MAYKNDSNIAHCGPAHQKSEPGAPKILGAIAA